MHCNRRSGILFECWHFGDRDQLFTLDKKLNFLIQDNYRANHIFFFPEVGQGAISYALSYTRPEVFQDRCMESQGNRKLRPVLNLDFLPVSINQEPDQGPKLVMYWC